MPNSNNPAVFAALTLTVRAQSIIHTDGADLGFAWDNGSAKLVILSADQSFLAHFVGEVSDHDNQKLLVGATNTANAAQLRALFPWLKARTLAVQTSAGFGDRLGLATPGHIRALRAVQQAAGKSSGSIAPIFAQQSIREMTRTERSAQQVMDDALWGVFSEGWRDGFGADADHLKTTEDIDRCVAAGFTFFTIDPGAYVDDRVFTDKTAIHEAFSALPWDILKDSEDAAMKRYTTAPIQLETQSLAFNGETLVRAAVKYGKVVAHVARMYAHLQQAVDGQPFELEVSVDETESVTTHAEHIYLAREFERLGVHFVSLAPRYVGRFEKGVDYIGDLDAFRADFALHAEIARAFGGYKLSLHSGSDKFSVYPIAAELTRGLVHLKTAGTSYLEALRTIANLGDSGKALLREIYSFGREHYDTDRASYHVSAELGKAPLGNSMSDAELPDLLEQFDARQILHVTFGSTLTALDASGEPRFKDRLLGLLRAHPDAYSAAIEKHFIRHLAPFVPFATPQ